MVTTGENILHEMLTIDAVNMDNDNWVFGCKATTVHNSQTICENGINLSQDSTIIPSNGKRKTITINMAKLRSNFTHIVVFMAKGMDHLRVTLDVYDSRERNLVAKLPKWISFWFETRLVAKTRKAALFYNFSIPGLDEPWQAYDVSAFPLQCDNKDEDLNSTKLHYGLLKMTNSWANDDTYKLIGQNMSNSIPVRITRAKTASLDPNTTKSEVHVYLNPECRYAISLRPNLAEMFGQIVRFYYPLILPLSISVVLMIIAHQFNLLEKEGQVYSCHRILWSQVSPMSSVLPSRLLSSVLPLLSVAWIKSDFAILAERGIDFGVLPIVMYFISIGVVSVLTLASFFTVIVFGNILNKVVKKIFSVNSLVEDVIVDTAINTVNRFPKILSAALLVIGVTTCGGLSLCIGTLFHFLKLFKMYKSYTEWLVKKSLGIPVVKKQEDYDKMYFHLSLGLLWALVSVLNLPSLLAWSHNVSLGFFQPLSPDHSYYTSIIYCLSIIFIWHDHQPDKYRIRYHWVSMSFQAASVLTVLFGLVSMYRINYFLSFVMICLVAHQIFAPTDLEKQFIPETAVEVNEDSKEKTD